MGGATHVSPPAESPEAAMGEHICLQGMSRRIRATLLFDEWDAVRFEWGSCPFCGSRNIRWVGTANWANPWKLLQQCLELINESAEGINFPTELREQFARLTTVCYECTPSTPEKALYQKLKQRIKKVTLEEPMWEPVELDEIKITLDTNEDREITDIDSE
jgi:hypothetical protein